MRIIKWVVSGIIVALLIFGGLQVFLLSNKVAEQSDILAELQREYSKGFFPILDLGPDVLTFPHTNDRGVTAISAYSVTPPLSRVYILQPDEVYPRLLCDLLTINSNYTVVDPPFVTREDAVLAFTGDGSDPVHFLAKIIRITPDGVATEVYSYDCGAQNPGGYFWGEDPYNGYLWKGHLIDGGIRIIKSTDGGLTWVEKYTNTYTFPPMVYEIAAYNDKVFVALGAPIAKILYSADGGTDWSEVLHAGLSFEGISMFGPMVYALNNETIWICPEYTLPTRWFEVYLPHKITLGDSVILRQVKMLGKYLVSSATFTKNSTTYYATADNFYTVSPLIRFDRPGKGVNERYSGFGNVMYIGGSGGGDGMVWKYKVPDVLPKGIPCLRTVLRINSLAGSVTSPLDSCFEFDSRLSATSTLTVTVTYDAEASSGIKIHIVSSSDGRYFDNVDTYEFLHPFTANTTQQKTYVFNGAGVIKVQIENLDESHAVTNIRVIATLGSEVDLESTKIK